MAIGLCLKSNMDRFIGAFAADDNLTYDRLKSNMDRFIECFCR